MSKKVLFLIALIFGSFGITNYAFSEGEADDPGDMDGTGCGSWNHTGGDCSVVWYEYTYNDNASLKNADGSLKYPETWIPSAYNKSTKWGDAGHIGKVGSSDKDSCRGEATRFFAKGVAMANTNSGYIYDDSQQFGMAPPDMSSKTNSSRTGTSSYAFSENFQIGGNTTVNQLTALSTFNGSYFATKYSKIPVADGHIVSRDAAHEAFCIAIGVSDIEACKSNNTDVLTNSNGESFTFEGSSNPASWFCGKIGKKEEELKSTSSVTVNDSSNNLYTSANGDDSTTTPSQNVTKTSVPAGVYSYNRKSVVSSQDDSVTNKIEFSTEMCTSGTFASFSGVPTVSTSKISAGATPFSTKCAHYDPGKDSFTSFTLYPGENKVISATVSHPSKIVKTGSNVSVAEDSNTESSSASVSLTADPIKCWNDDRYKIGDGNFSNYYKLGLSKNGSSFEYTKVYPYTYEEDKKNITYWAKPDDVIQFRYDFCSGGVLKDDIDGVANDTVKANTYYTVKAGSNFDDKAWIWNSSDSRVTSLGITGSNFGDTGVARINNKYTYGTNSPLNHSYKIENGTNLIGSVISNHLGETSGMVKIPYNYVLQPSINELTASSLTVGSKYSFKASVSVKGRKNLQTGAIDTDKATDVKEDTKSFAAIFAISNNKSQSELSSKLAEFSNRIGETDEYYYNNSSDSPLVKLGDFVDYDTVMTESDDIINREVSLEYTVKDDEKVGTKICSIVAVYPADSHNTLMGSVDSDEQTAALSHSFGDNPYWRFRINCSTVGKYPTISIEGASLVAGGEVNTRTVNYNGGIFGSWAEYDLVASKANNAGSGAALAYSTDHAQTTPNAIGDINADGNRSGNLKNPQTLGNLALDYGISSDAQDTVRLAKEFAENIDAFCYNQSGNMSGNCEELSGATSIDNSKNGFVIYKNTDNSSFTIDSDIYNNSQNAVIVIYGKNIQISNSVKRIDAVIIATESLDTCSEEDKDATTGNQGLLEKCSNELIVNGAVYTKGDDNLKLDRVYGGGSLEGDALNPASLLQRAEIFSYDPRIVKVGQNIAEGLDITEVQYIKELAPRY